MGLEGHATFVRDHQGPNILLYGVNTVCLEFDRKKMVTTRGQQRKAILTTEDYQ